jgi:hypothetical protein
VASSFTTLRKPVPRSTASLPVTRSILKRSCYLRVPWA